MKVPKPPSCQRPGFGAAIFRRTVLEGLGSRMFGEAEVAAALRFFGAPPLECSYCGSQTVTRWDHLVPVLNGGETVLGNMVPACGSCDDSKAQRDFEIWMRSGAPRSPASRGVPDLDARISKLYRYMEEFGYAPKALADRLTKGELDQLQDLLARLETLRREAEAFIGQVGVRRATEITCIAGPSEASSEDALEAL